MAHDAGASATDGRGHGNLTMRDIARLANVSSKSVSLVVNGLPGVSDETRARIEALIAEHGYVPQARAQGLATGRAFLVGHVYNNPNPEYLITMQQGLLDGLEGTGYALVTFPLDREHPQFTERLREFVGRHRLDGLVFSSSVAEDERLLPLLSDLRVPYVRVASTAVDVPENSVVGVDRDAAFLAGEHVVGLGHERIGFVSGPMSFLSARERRGGFEQALAVRGLVLDEHLVVEGDYTFEAGLRAGEALLGIAERPTAVFAANDEMAAGVLQAAQRAGLEVPRELTVVGFDDFSIANHVQPRLTTVRIPTRAMGRLAILTLLETSVGVSGRTPAQDTPRPELVVRETSGPVAHREQGNVHTDQAQEDPEVTSGHRPTA